MQLAENISLKPYNTFGIDAAARYFAAFQNISELEELCNYKLPLTSYKFILGGGSNILLTKNIDGIVLQNKICGIEVINEDEDYIYVKAGAGEAWHQFVLHCIAHGYAGVENLSLIPGSVGASPMQNIGAYGVEIKDVFHELEAYHLQDGRTQKFSKEACAFGYRESVFKHKYKGQYVITSVTFRLYKKPRFNISLGVGNSNEKKAAPYILFNKIAEAASKVKALDMKYRKRLLNCHYQMTFTSRSSVTPNLSCTLLMISSLSAKTSLPVAVP